jgi:hypothetical protein
MITKTVEERLSELERESRELRDRREIHEIVMRYCRALDRFDRELLLSCFHSDAIDDHGMFVGSPVELADWAYALHKQEMLASNHCITNHFCDLQGDVAHTESYYYSADMRRRGPPARMLGGGRYIDRFERRSGTWAIAARVHRREWWSAGEPLPEKMVPHIENEPTWDRSDPSYQRPLTITTKSPGWRYR